jgi:hypothetical protein
MFGAGVLDRTHVEEKTWREDPSPSFLRYHRSAVHLVS